MELKKAKLRFWQPCCIYEMGLCSDEEAIYGFLCSRSDHYQCQVPYESIGKAVKLDADEVPPHIKKLVDAQLISVEKNIWHDAKGGSGVGANIYTILPFAEAYRAYTKRKKAEKNQDKPAPPEPGEQLALFSPEATGEENAHG